MQDSQDVVDAKDWDSLSKHLNKFNKEKSITGDLKKKNKRTYGQEIPKPPDCLKST